MNVPVTIFIRIPNKRRQYILVGRNPCRDWSSSIEAMLIRGIMTWHGAEDYFCNWDGIKIKCFIKKIGSWNALHVEMWGMHFSLDMVWRDHISHLIVKNDSKLLINMITRNCATRRVIHTMVRRIHNLLTLDWKVQVCHTWLVGEKHKCW